MYSKEIGEFVLPFMLASLATVNWIPSISEMVTGFVYEAVETKLIDVAVLALIFSHLISVGVIDETTCGALALTSNHIRSAGGFYVCRSLMSSSQSPLTFLVQNTDPAAVNEFSGIPLLIGPTIPRVPPEPSEIRSATGMTGTLYFLGMVSLNESRK